MKFVVGGGNCDVEAGPGSELSDTLSSSLMAHIISQVCSCMKRWFSYPI